MCAFAMYFLSAMLQGGFKGASSLNRNTNTNKNENTNTNREREKYKYNLKKKKEHFAPPSVIWQTMSAFFECCAFGLSLLEKKFSYFFDEKQKE